jgi:hypothetical protein
MVEETLPSGASVSLVVRAHDVNANRVSVVSKWSRCRAIWIRPGLIGLLDGVMSPFLSDLYRAWRRVEPEGGWRRAGRLVLRASRSVPGYNNGCRATNPLSDAVVCQESAVLSFPDNPLQMTPNEEFTDPSRRFQHGEDVGLYVGGNVLCGNPPFGTSVAEFIAD